MLDHAHVPVVDIVFLTIEQPLVNPCPRKALVAPTEAERGSVVGEAPLAPAVSAVGLSEITPEQHAELLDVVLRWLGRRHAGVQQPHDILNLGNEGLRVVSRPAKFVPDKLDATISRVLC